MRANGFCACGAPHGVRHVPDESWSGKNIALFAIKSPDKFLFSQFLFNKLLFYIEMYSNNKLRFYHIIKCFMLMIMAQRIHEKIKEVLETTPGLTQRGLADAMGLDPAAVNRMMHGRRCVMADEIPVIEAYLGQPLPIAAAPALSMTGTALPVQRPGTPRGVSDVSRQAQLADAPAAGTAALPVVPVYAFGDTQRDRPLDYVVRHPLQAGMAEAFAYYMPDDALAPRYFTGEIIYVHPTRPPVAARDCIIIHVDGTAKLARLMAQTAHKIRVQCFAPQKEKDIPRKNISALYSVVGRG